MDTQIFNINIGTNDPTWIIPGLSSLYHMASGSFVFDSPYRFAIPGNLIKLLEFVDKGSEEHAEFLKHIVLEDHADKQELSGDEIAASLIPIFAELEGLDRLVVISRDMIDQEIEEALSDSFADDGYNISLSPKRNFVRDYFSRALSYSKKTGAIIIETTKNKFVALGEYIVSLQLPNKADAFVKDKQKFISRVFSFRGGKWTKWFIGASISVGGLAYPPLGVLGVGIAFADP